MNITVLGAGSWGIALALLLNENGHNVTIWCYDEKERDEILTYRENKRCFKDVKIPIEINITSEISLKDSKVIVMAVPSVAIRQTARSVLQYMDKDAVVVNVAKGIEQDTGLRLSEVIQSEVENDVVVLSGPSHAEEVVRHMPTAVTVASVNMEAAEKIQQIFTSSYFRVYTTDDIIGVEIGAALKNVIALAAGAIEGLGYGDNTKAALMTRGIAEISRLGVAMGGNIITLQGLAGIGDLIVTCTSKHSRNRMAGELIAKGYTTQEAVNKINMIVEGIPATKIAYQLKEKYNIDMPITTAIYQSLFNNKPVRESINELMLRDTKAEQG